MAVGHNRKHLRVSKKGQEDETLDEIRTQGALPARHMDLEGGDFVGTSERVRERPLTWYIFWDSNAEEEQLGCGLSPPLAP